MTGPHSDFTLGAALTQGGIGPGQWTDADITVLCPMCGTERWATDLVVFRPGRPWALHYRCPVDAELLVTVNDPSLTPPDSIPLGLAGDASDDVQQIMAFGRIYLRADSGLVIELGVR